MSADWHISRRDAEDDYEDAREVYIAERSAELLAEYQRDDDKVTEAVKEFMSYGDGEDHIRATWVFLCSYRNTETDRGIADAANALATDLQSYINPILREWAEDKAREELAQNETNQSEARSAA
jgi:hypothetical protein